MFAAIGSSAGVGAFHTVTQLSVDATPSPSRPMALSRRGCLEHWRKPNTRRPNRPLLPISASVGDVGQEGAATLEDANATESERQRRRSADWKAARAYKESGLLYTAHVDGFNNGGLLIRFYSIMGFLPFSELSLSRSAKDPKPSIQDVGKSLVGSSVEVKVVQVNEEMNKLIFSEKDAIWLKCSSKISVGDVVEGKVTAVEDFGAFINLHLPDGESHLTGLVHISEVSWDFVQDVRDVLKDGDLVKVKVVEIDRSKSRIGLSIKQLVSDPLLETLAQVIPQEGQPEFDTSGSPTDGKMEPLPGLESICNELLQEDGITDVKLGRQGLEKRVVSQDLEIWLSNAPAKDNQFVLLARAGRRVQEIHLTTNLDQDGIKDAVRRILSRIP